MKKPKKNCLEIIIAGFFGGLGFPGTSENAVMTQIRAALIHYLLVAYIKFLNHISRISFRGEE